MEDPQNPDEAKKLPESNSQPPSLPASQSPDCPCQSAPSLREQLHALVTTPEWPKLLRAVNAVLRMHAPAHRRQDIESGVVVALVEWAELNTPVESWAGLAVVITNRIIIKAVERDRLELLELGQLPASSRTSYDELVAGDRAVSLNRLRGSVQKTIIEAISAGESCESIAERLGKTVEEVRWLCGRIAEKIKNLEKTRRQSQPRGTL